MSASDVARLKASVSISSVIAATVPLKRHGAEFTACCPFHPENTPSFTVNDSKGFYHCFGCNAHGDVFDWLEKKQGMKLAEAVAHLDGAPASEAAPPRRPERIGEWEPIIPVPEHAAPPPAVHFRHGKPTHVARYLTREGGLIGMIYRCEPEGGKQPVPLTFCERVDGRQEWRWLSFPKPRSLYGAELLTREGRILICEGEPKTDAARRMLGGRMIVLAWPGGAGAAQHADWSMLAGRDVVIWPDSDPAGFTAAAQITIQLRHHGATVRTVEVPADAPRGWDLADAEREGWDADRVMSYVDPPEPEPEQEPNYDYSEGEEPIANFRPLGHDNGKFYFHSSGGGQVRDFTARDLQSAACLMELANLTYWEMNYPGKGDAGFNIKSACNDLVRACYKVGIYDAARIRGRGAWLDEGRGVLHLGDHCLVDGVETSIVIPNSRYIYEHSQRMDVTLGEPLSNLEANRLRELCIMLPWESPAHMGNLLAGWCVIAPICGALPWRPHVWLTGESGSGKSWCLENIIKMALGPIALSVQSKTTEAGIRQSLGRDGRPVLFDEAEGQNEADRARIQHVLDLARQASSEGGAAIIKGSSGGKATQFYIRSCFLFGSINVSLSQAADESRMVVLTLKPIQDRTKRAENFAAIEAFHARAIDDNFAGRLLARTLQLLPVIRANGVVFANAIARSGKPKRLGDTYGVLMAGAWSLRSRAVATVEEADRMVEETQWVKDAVVKSEVEAEWSRALKTMLQHRIRYSARGETGEVPVGDLLEAAQGRVGDGPLGASDATKQLNWIGIRVQDGYLQVANRSVGCDGIFARTPWAGSWASTMQRAPGTVRNIGPVRLAGHLTKVFGIPLLELSK